jgi:dTDP-4-amino-4,6-dideoxygalactose transaminase
VVPFLRERTGNPPLPVSEETAARFFCAPMHPRMSDEDNEYICAALWDAVERLR